MIRAKCWASASTQESTKLEIKWPQPSGRTETFTDLPIDRYITIVEGQVAVQLSDTLGAGSRRPILIRHLIPVNADDLTEISRPDDADAMVRKFVMRTGQLNLGHVTGYAALFRNRTTLSDGNAP